MWVKSVLYWDRDLEKKSARFSSTDSCGSTASLSFLRQETEVSAKRSKVSRQTNKSHDQTYLVTHHHSYATQGEEKEKARDK